MLIFGLIKRICRKGLYFIECLCAMKLSNLLKCWLCDNVNLNVVWISRELGTRRQCMTVFSKKKLNKTSVKRLIFYKLDTSLKLKWEKLLVKDVQNGMYCTSKTLSCNRWTAIWLRQQQKWLVKQKKLISTPVLGLVLLLMLRSEIMSLNISLFGFRR